MLVYILSLLQSNKILVKKQWRAGCTWC